MNCKVSESAAKKLSEILDQEDDKNLKCRIFVGHAHGNHAHYGLGLDYQKDTDVLIRTETGIDVVLEKVQDFLDGVEVDYNASTDEWSIINPTKGNHGDHQ